MPGKSETKNIIMFGKTGAGKSLLGCVLLNDYEEKFAVSQNTYSETKETSSFVNPLQNVKIFDTKGFLDTDDEIENQKGGGSPQTMVFKALETVGCIGKEGVHAVLLVLKLARISQAEGELAKKALMRLFDHDVREKILLIITCCEDNLVEEPEVGEEWIKENTKDAGSHFKNYYALVGKDPKKVIFVNNTNPKTVKEKNKKSRLEDNQEMADKIFGIIQNNECFEKKAYLSENIMAYKKLLAEEAKKAEETKARENDLKKKLSEFTALLDRQQTVSAEDKKKMDKLDSELADTKSRLADVMSSLQDKFNNYKTAALGDSGLGSIPLVTRIMGGVGQLGGAVIDVIDGAGKAMGKFGSWLFK